MPIDIKSEAIAKSVSEAAVFTKADFIREYEKGSQMYIDLDPRVDFTKPVYAQVLKLQELDEANALHDERAEAHEAA